MNDKTSVIVWKVKSAFRILENKSIDLSKDIHQHIDDTSFSFFRKHFSFVLTKLFALALYLLLLPSLASFLYFVYFYVFLYFYVFGVFCVLLWVKWQAVCTVHYPDPREPTSRFFCNTRHNTTQHKITPQKHDTTQHVSSQHHDTRNKGNSTYLNFG